MSDRTIAPDCREGEPCPRCGRIVRPDRKTPGCYLGRCIAGMTDEQLTRRSRWKVERLSSPRGVDIIDRMVRPVQLSFPEIDRLMQATP